MTDKSKTPQEIIAMIDLFCKENENETLGILPGYDFAHIVLADYNLYDRNIEFCLNKKGIAEWLHQQAKDSNCLPGECDWWMLSSYVKIVDYILNVTTMLQQLLQIPENEREAAMEWYWNSST